MVRNVIIGAGLAGALAAGAAGYAVLGPDGSGAGAAAGAVGAGSLDRPVAAYDCPGGSELSVLHGGDRVYIVGRAEGDGGAWLQIRNPEVPAEQWWMPEHAVTADASLDELPEASCDDPVGTGEVEVAAGEVPAPEEPTDPEHPTASTETTLGDEPVPTLPSGEPDPAAVAVPGDPAQPPRPGPAPRPGTPTTRPPTTRPPVTQPADTTAPSLSGFLASVHDVNTAAGGEFCSPRPTVTRLSVAVGDPSGVQSVTVQWAIPETGIRTVALTPQGGGRWGADVSVAVPVHAPSVRTMSWQVRAVDARGNATAWVGATGKDAEVKVWGC